MSVGRGEAMLRYSEIACLNGCVKYVVGGVDEVGCKFDRSWVCEGKYHNTSIAVRVLNAFGDGFRALRDRYGIHARDWSARFLAGREHARKSGVRKDDCLYISFQLCWIACCSTDLTICMGLLDDCQEE